MAIVGLKTMWVAKIDPTTNKIVKGKDGLTESGVLEIGDQYFGSKTANITGLEGAITAVYGNNKLQDQVQGAPKPVVALDINNLGFPILQQLLGNNPTGNGGYGEAKVKPTYGLIVASETLDRNNSVYFCFGKGTFTQPSQNIGTDNENQTREDDNLTYNALSSKNFGGDTTRKYYDGDTDFNLDKMFAETFGIDDTQTPPENGGGDGGETQSTSSSSVSTATQPTKSTKANKNR